MKTIKYIILGIIQGLTEPLPISSSAHMIFINHYLGGTDLDLTTEVFINFASTLAIFIFLIVFMLNFCKKRKDLYICPLIMLYYFEY